MQAPTPDQRLAPRNNQIAIRLHCQSGGGWQRLEAQQWTPGGFCFFHAQPFAEAVLTFKRSLQHFEGEIVWSRVCHDQAQVLEMLLNESLHSRLSHHTVTQDTRQRLLRLIRVQGMADAKLQVLAALGETCTPDQWQHRVQERMQTALFQSGVRITSPVWNAVVAEAQSLGGVVQDLERWSGSLGKG